MTPCGKHQAELDAWTPDGGTELSDELALHLDACESCRNHFDGLFLPWLEEEATASLSEDHVDRLLPPAQRRRVPWAGIGLAASALLVAGVGLSGLVFSTTHHSAPVQNAEAPVGKTTQMTRAEAERLFALGYMDQDAKQEMMAEWGVPPEDGRFVDGHASSDVKTRRYTVRQKGYDGNKPTMQITRSDNSALILTPEPATSEHYIDYGLNRLTRTADDPLSTFAIDVDTASYTVTRRKLNQGYLPPVAAVRVEEFVNYFPYEYAHPTGAPFAVDFEAAPSPWTTGSHLVRIGVQGKRVGWDQRKPVNLTFLVDTSGSMQSDDKLGLVKDTLTMLTRELEDGDRVAIVAYAGSAGLVLPPTPMSEKDDVLDAVERLTAGGSTAMGAGIELAYAQADAAYRSGSVNRVIICSDGDANVGVTSHEALTELIGTYAEKGITLTTVGYGQGNYQDTMMERLANDGDGNYFYIDSELEARRVFVDRLTSTMEVIAKDVKIQVEWDADVVSDYRLVGYENRDIADEDFRDDAVDAGEIGSGHQVTALYEVSLTGIRGDLGTVRVRNKAPGPDAPAVERSYALSSESLRDSFDESSRDFRIAAAAAGFADRLRHNPDGPRDWASVERIAEGAIRAEYPEDAELLELIRKAKELSRE